MPTVLRAIPPRPCPGSRGAGAPTAGVTFSVQPWSPPLPPPSPGPCHSYSHRTTSLKKHNFHSVHSVLTRTTHSQWKLLNTFKDTRKLLLIGCVEPNPGPAQPRQLKIAHVNINSITTRHRIDELQQFVDAHNIDVLALSETKLDDSIHPDQIQNQRLSRSSNQT